MLDLIRSPLDAFPEGVVRVRGGEVAYINGMAGHYLPDLSPGLPLPGWIPLPEEGEAGTGLFTVGANSYTYSCTPQGEEWTILFRPAPQAALTGRQLEGALLQLRGLLGEILAEVGPAAGKSGKKIPADAFSKSFHRLLRLTGNLEFMQQSAGEGETVFHPVTMDLAGLCRHVSELAGLLLQQAGVTLNYESAQSGLLIPGDPELLQRLLLELISNSARAAGEGRVTLSLCSAGGRARISIGDSGPVPDRRQLESMFQQGLGDSIPLPGQGAGLGLSIAHRIVALHGGAMLVKYGDCAPSILIALPTGPLDGRAALRTPALQRDGGLDPVLLELSDVLPAHLFGIEDLD